MNAQTEMTEEILDILEGVENGNVLVKHAHAAIMRTINFAHLTKPDAGGGEVRNFCPTCGKRLHKDSIHTCTPPSDVPAEPSVVPMPPTEHCRYRIAWGDGDTVIVEAAGQRDVIETIHYLSVETAQAYADARVSEATRELVDGLRGFVDHDYTFMGEAVMGTVPKLTRSQVYAARALIAKYTQTQKESK